MPASTQLVGFVDALLSSPEELPAARDALIAAAGPAALVDAAAVAAQFQALNRIADATGIPLDAPLGVVAADLQDGLDLRRFASSANTPTPGLGQRAMRTLLGPVARAAMPYLGRILPKQDK